MPPSLRSRANPSRGRVSSLWTYAWWPVSHRMRSFGLSNTRCSARVSSTTPRLGPRWPPVLDTVATRNWRISSARAPSSASLSERRSAGLVIRSSTGVLETWSIFGDSSLANGRQYPGRGATACRALWFRPVAPLPHPAGRFTLAIRGHDSRGGRSYGHAADAARFHAPDAAIAPAAGSRGRGGRPAHLRAVFRPLRPVVGSAPGDGRRPG